MSDSVEDTIEIGSKEYMLFAVEGRHQSVRQVMRHFAWNHLPEHLQPYSKACANLALRMCALIQDDDPELTLGLHKLKEAKDCFVRAALEARRAES